MPLFDLVFMRLKTFLCWFLSLFRQRLLSDFQQNFTTTSMYIYVIYMLHAGQQTSSRAMGKVMGGRGLPKVVTTSNNKHTSIANCLVVLAIWEDALVIVVCYTWVLAAFSLVLCSHWILFLACFKACGFLWCALAKNKSWHHPKQTKHQMSTMNLESSLEFCKGGRQRVRVEEEGTVDFPCSQTKQTFCVCD